MWFGSGSWDSWDAPTYQALLEGSRWRLVTSIYIRAVGLVAAFRPQRCTELVCPGPTESSVELLVLHSVEVSCLSPYS